MSGAAGGQGDPDDDLRQLFNATFRGIQPTIHQPPVREVIARARGTRHGSPAGKPAPLAAILALGATPLVVIGAVLIGPAAAGILSGNDNAVPAPTVSLPSPVTTTAAAPLAPTSAPAVSPGGAVAPLTKVTVYFSDAILATDGCRKLTAATRLVPGDQLVQATLESLLAGPRPDERAAGLVNQFSSDAATAAAATVTVDETSSNAVVDIADEASLGGTAVECRKDEIGRALEKTVRQFDGWSTRLQLAGSSSAADSFLAEDPSDPAPEPGDPVSDATAVPSGDPGAPTGDVATATEQPAGGAPTTTAAAPNGQGGTTATARAATR